MARPPVIDTDEHGKPVREEHRRLGAGAISETEEGWYVRFETGFGTNVHIGHRHKKWHPDFGDRGIPEDNEKLVMSIQGWDRLCELVDEHRARLDGDARG